MSKFHVHSIQLNTFTGNISYITHFCSNFSEDDTYFTTLNRDFSYYNEDEIDALNFNSIQSYEEGNENSRSIRNPFRVVRNVVGWAIGRIHV